ncbi:MAG: hypothetical protein M3Y85_07765 [Bacteroidota bacterium]|nr:hypothetical protein [Bacteroidota bacterium]
MKNSFFTLLFAFLSSYLFAQLPATYVAVSNNIPCPVSLTLYPDGVYLFKSGCDASPQISFGKWATKKDTVKLEPVDLKTYQVIKTVNASHVPGDSIWISILDKDDVNITNKISIGLEISGRGSYMFNSDSSGTQKFVYKRPGGKIALRTLNKLFNRNFELMADTANHFVVTLNLSGAWINSTHAGWNGFGPFAVLKRKEGFVTCSSHFLKPLIFHLKEETTPSY